MIQLIIGIFILLASSIWYYWSYKPKKVAAFFKKQFQAQGYKVFLCPYQFNDWTITNYFLKGEQEDQDCQKYFKQALSDYDLAISNIANQCEIVLFNPDLIAQFYAVERQFFYVRHHLMKETFKRSIGDALGLIDGEYWKKSRKVFVQATNNSMIQQSTQKTKTAVKRVLKSLELKGISDQESSGKDGIYKFLARQLSSQLFTNIGFSIYGGGDLSKQKLNGINPITYLIDVTVQAFLQFNDPLAYFLGNNFLKLGLRKKDKILNHKIQVINQWATEKMKSYIASQAQKFKADPQNYKHQNLLTLMAFNRKIDKNGKQQFTFNQREILDQFFTILFAGVDGISHLFRAMFFYVFHNPEIQAKFRQQIKDLSEDFTYAQIKKLEYYDAIFSQTLRMAGSGNFSFPRTVIKDHTFKGINIPKGLIFTHIPIVSHYSKKYFKQPNQFRPERWFNGECENLPPHTLGGFNGGSRVCPGKNLSYYTLKVVMILLAQRYKKISFSTDNLKWTLKMLIESVDFEVRVQKA